MLMKTDPSSPTLADTAPADDPSARAVNGPAAPAPSAAPPGDAQR